MSLKDDYEKFVRIILILNLVNYLGYHSFVIRIVKMFSESVCACGSTIPLFTCSYTLILF